MLIQTNKIQTMAKYSAPFIALLLFTLASCQTLEELSIDYMLPADISFPVELKRVAIVNNISATPDNQIPPKEAPQVNEISRAVAHPEGNAATTLQSLAESIAQENYFDLVVICDSALRAKDITSRESTLSQQEVQSLITKLDVDFIIALENLQMKATRILRYLPAWSCFQGTIDMKVFPTLKVYLPTRKGPMVTIHAKDSIFWEELGGTETYVRTHLREDDKIVEEASEFAGTVPMKYLLPYWKTGKRYIYTGGSVNMRDAAIYVRENSWEKAFKLWEQVFQSTQSPKKQMCAALNIALYYEMKDEVEKAQTWAIKAQELASKVDKVGDSLPDVIDLTRIPNYVMTTRYVVELKQRTEGLSKLNMQMSRFNDDF